MVAAGSTVAGNAYKVTQNVAPIELPSCLAARLHQPTAAQPSRPTFAAALSTATRRDRYLTAALTNEVARVRTALQGQRNHTLYIAALRLGELTAGGHLDPDVVTEALLCAGQANGLTPRECQATIHSGLKAGERSPREIPA